MELNQILGEFFCQKYLNDMDGNYKIEEIDARELIVSERIDLIAKIKYIECRENGEDLKYIKELYTAHIEAFSNGTYIEPGNQSKNTIYKYFDVFNNLIDNLKKSGLNNEISVIPVGNNNVILDGAHRVSIAAYFNLKVPIIRFENLHADYGIEYFQKKLLNQKHIDYLVTEYCKLKDNLHFICTWSAFEGDFLIKTINSECKVIYRNKLKISYESFQNLIVQQDLNLRWLGSQDGNGDYLTIYLIECNNFIRILESKTDILNTPIEDFIHITNNKKETIKLAYTLLSGNLALLLQRKNQSHYSELQISVKRKVRNLKYNCRSKVVIITKKVGIYNALKSSFKYFSEIVK